MHCLGGICMPNIYTGDIKNMYISDLELRDKNVQNLFNDNFKFNFGEVVVEKDSEFYGNLFHMIVNFRYDNVLATREEAIGYLKNSFYETKDSLLKYLEENNIDDNKEFLDKLMTKFDSSILFVDYEDLKLRSIVDKKTIKDKKNIYKLYK